MKISKIFQSRPYLFLLISLAIIASVVYLFVFPERSQSQINPSDVYLPIVLNDATVEAPEQIPDYTDHHDMTLAELEELVKDFPAYEVDEKMTRAALASNLGGEWGDVIEWPHIPVSAANLPDGRLITWASNQKTCFPGGQP